MTTAAAASRQQQLTTAEAATTVAAAEIAASVTSKAAVRAAVAATATAVISAARMAAAAAPAGTVLPQVKRPPVKIKNKLSWRPPDNRQENQTCQNGSLIRRKTTLEIHKSDDHELDISFEVTAPDLPATPRSTASSPHPRTPAPIGLHRRAKNGCL